MKNIFISILLLMGTVCAQAQTEKEELAEFPETMQSDMDSLYWDWQSKNFIFMDELSYPPSSNVSIQLFPEEIFFATISDFLRKE